ncbi:hypothetical protein cce_4104 [Crocosphaera subtropica ATCC 51142]|uniref:Uncharacterized protein n=1 Tax=Crocosphaera subtropica (strain ATCC 51142 / BH68) TaxID=43989 RepID=B1WRL1_CROS5|nr:hypothetical protein [Crocosphaera subtropica]ACB53452.1 hypothetical protein cce_4104 [Crocosphaera subtropica ATCC 51142]
MKTIEIGAEHYPTRKEIELMAEAEGIIASDLWKNNQLVSSYVVTYSIAIAARSLENQEKVLIKFPSNANLEFIVNKENGKIKIDRGFLNQHLKAKMSNLLSNLIS